MKLLRKIRKATAQPKERVTSNEFCHLFAEEMTGLYLLSLLLTTSPEMAERCFVTALEDCLNGVTVAKEWAHSWAKRVVIKNAIRLMAPNLRSASRKTFSISTRTNDEQRRRCEENPTIDGVLALEDFDRLVFVMSVLERYPDRDCAALLDCRREEIRTGRTRALQQIAMWNCRTERI
ncbi:MAG: hypothetical protein WA634_20365 [Silvibacterium sp.]